MLLEGGIEKNYTQNWDKNGNIYYTDENGRVVDFKVNPFVKLANKVKAGVSNFGDWINESNPNSEAYKQKVGLVAGLTTAPFGIGELATAGVTRALAPYVGRKIAQNMATGFGSGVAGGGVGGGLEAGLNNENIFAGGLKGSVFGGLGGLVGGYGLGKVGQKFERGLLQNNPVAQEQYFNDYIADLNNKTRAMADFRAGKLGMKNGKMQLAYDLVADESGNPISFYHGTPNAGFMEFNPLSHFTKNKDYASIYKSPSASSIQVKQTANNPAVYEVNLDVNKMFDTRNPIEKNIFNNEYQAYYSPDLTERGLPDWMEAEDLAEWLQSKYPEYDALVVDEGATGGYGDIVKNRGESYIPFSPKQIKIKNIEYDR